MFFQENGTDRIVLRNSIQKQNLEITSNNLEAITINFAVIEKNFNFYSTWFTWRRLKIHQVENLRKV